MWSSKLKKSIEGNEILDKKKKGLDLVIVQKMRKNALEKFDGLLRSLLETELAIQKYRKACNLIQNGSRARLAKLDRIFLTLNVRAYRREKKKNREIRERLKYSAATVTVLCLEAMDLSRFKSR